LSGVFLAGQEPWPTCSDADGDGYGNPASASCTYPEPDCDDTDPAVNPGAGEACDDGIDNDCDGLQDGDDPDCIMCDLQDEALSCGATVAGSTSGGENVLEDYGCVFWQEDGPEYIYGILVEEMTRLTAALDALGDANLGIYVIEAEEDQACEYNCIDFSDGVGGDEELVFDASPGAYFIVIDGYEGASDDFSLNLACEPLCHDLDEDGYEDHACGGDDCDDADPDTNPGAAEICDDEIDNDCDGLADGDDSECIFCDAADQVISCGDTVSTTTTGGTNVLEEYACAFWPESGPELVYELLLEEETVVTVNLSASAGANLGIYLLSGGDEACEYDCIAYADSPGGSEELVLTAAAGSYFIVVDGYGGASDDFDLTLACDPVCYDTDGDGYEDESCGGDDCDDADPDIHPGAVEVCDGVDEDCDGVEDNDVVCEFPNASGVCHGAWGCQFGDCDANYENCDGDQVNGCEAYLNGDVSNCGACDHTCINPHGTTACTSGLCSPSCSGLWGDCDGDPDDGCDDPLTTLSNCGACGSSCALSNATESCTSGTCQVVSCSSGWCNEDGLPYNGCEHDLDTNPACSAYIGLGTVRGDEGSDTVSWVGHDERWFRVYVTEDAAGCDSLSAEIELDVPSGTNYDLYAYCSGCSGISDSSTAGGSSNETVRLYWDDECVLGIPTGTDQSRDIYIRVAHVSANVCSDYTLTVSGNTGSGGQTCD